MEERLARLRYIVTELTELMGAIQFGEERLNTFLNTIHTFSLTINRISDYKTYKKYLAEHTRHRVLYQSTLNALLHWQTFNEECREELLLVSVQKEDALFFLFQNTLNSINDLSLKLDAHLLNLDKVEIEIKNQQQILLQKKAEFALSPSY